MKSTLLEENRFTENPMEENPQEELFAQDWDTLLNRYTGMPWQFLREMFVELNFPISEGQSENPELIAALKRGILPSSSQDVWIPHSPEKIHVYLQPTPAGRIPVIECESDTDFIHIQQSLVYRCEPRPVPDSRGATIIKNYNNWGRINMHRKNLVKNIFVTPELYRDYIILLSHRYYSGVAPEIFGLESDEWRRKSLILRREHEIAHYMTQRYYHSTKNEIHDEIIADFMGLTAAFGEYDPNKFITFMGLENYPKYRIGGRLEVYLPKGGKDFNSLCVTLMQAAQNIVAYYNELCQDRMNMFHTLCRTSVADMAKGNFATVLRLISKKKDFEIVFKEQFKIVYDYIRYHVRDAADAEDLASDVFARAYKYWSSYSAEKGSRGEWIGGIVRNMVKTHAQKKANEHKIIELSEFIPSDTDIESDYLRKDEIQKVLNHMDTLPEHERVLLILKYIAGYTNQEIAEAMGMSAGNVGVKLHRIIKKLQTRLKVD